MTKHLFFFVGLSLIASCSHSNIQNKVEKNTERFPADEGDSCLVAIRSLMKFQATQNRIEAKQVLNNDIMEFIRLKLSSTKNENEIKIPSSLERVNKFFFVNPTSQKVMDKDSLVVIKDPVYTSYHVPLEPGIMLRQGLYTNKGQLASTQWISIVFPKLYMDPYQFKAQLSTFIESIVEQAPNFNLSSIEKVVAADGSTSYSLLKTMDGKANMTSFHASALNTKSEFNDQFALDLAISPEDNIEDVLLLIEKIDLNLRFKYYGQ